jgi:hypothetical protein
MVRRKTLDDIGSSTGWMPAAWKRASGVVFARTVRVRLSEQGCAGQLSRRSGTHVI